MFALACYIVYHILASKPRQAREPRKACPGFPLTFLVTLGYDYFMAQYHKIPQNVTNYQGRIVGKFTAKQFIFLAIGAMGAFLVFNSSLAQNTRIVLVVIIVIVTIFISLASFQGRSTDAWVASFIAAVYQPTQRVWRKSLNPPPYLLPGYHPAHAKLGPRKRSVSELNELISIWEPAETPRNELSNSEKSNLARIRELEQAYNESAQTQAAQSTNANNAPNSTTTNQNGRDTK